MTTDDSVSMRVDDLVETTVAELVGSKGGMGCSKVAGTVDTRLEKSDMLIIERIKK